MSIVAQKITYIHPDNQVLFKGIDLTINKGQKVAFSREQRIGKIHLPPYLGWNLASAGRGDYLSDPTLLRTPAFRAI